MRRLQVGNDLAVIADIIRSCRTWRHGVAMEHLPHRSRDHSIGSEHHRNDQTAYCFSAPSRVDVPNPYDGIDVRLLAGCLPSDDGCPYLHMTRT